MKKLHQNIVIVPSGGTNLSSVKDAIEELGYEVTIASDEKTIRSATKVILPGVGAASNAMETLNRLQLVDCIPSLQQDVLGICLGMQLLFQSSEENHESCLGIIPEKIVRIPRPSIVPHMGWNELCFQQQDHPILQGIEANSFVYFTHSYYAPHGDGYTIASTKYDGLAISAIVQKDNFYGMQFHPERSGKVGIRLLQNFLAL